MPVKKLVPDDNSLAICKAFADMTGLPFNPAVIEQSAGQLTTLYFEDIQAGLAPRFDDVRIADFTRFRINAYSDSCGEAARPFVHVDQLFEMWVNTLVFLWSIRAIHELRGENLDGLNKLFLWTLDIRDRPSSRTEVLEDLMHVIPQFKEALRFAHDLTINCMTFILCHELAHHELAHTERQTTPDLEFEADATGYEIMRGTLQSNNGLRTVRSRPFSMIAPWMSLQLLDLSERRQAQRNGASSRTPSGSHPFASDRVARILHLTNQETDPAVAHFLDGYGTALEKFRRDLELDCIG